MTGPSSVVEIFFSFHGFWQGRAARLHHEAQIRSVKIFMGLIKGRIAKGKVQRKASLAPTVTDIIYLYVVYVEKKFNALPVEA